jgi:protein-L-isoaspartate(D-aspartate) O-methyltransferase
MEERQRMVYEIRMRYGLKSPKVLSAMFEIPRHEFVSKKYKKIAYEDRPVSIGYDQTMSQPYTVAFMTHLLTDNKIRKRSKRIGSVLEVGTGSGYQAALLSKFFNKVYTVEIVPDLAKIAKENLRRLGYKNVFVKIGSGEYGWKEKAPFDAVIITAGLGEKVPKSLFTQLKNSGILVAPLGDGYDKTMTRITKKKGRFHKEEFGIFHFVPFVEEGD